jgi:hypothetical protein
VLWIRIDFNPKPDPAFLVNADPIPDSSLMAKNCKKYTAEKSVPGILFLSNIAIYLSLDLRKGHPKYNRILLPSKGNIQLFKT